MSRGEQADGWRGLGVLGMLGILVAGFCVSLTSYAPRTALDVAPLTSGWGVDACLTCHVPLEAVDGFVDLLREARLTYLRERGPGDVRQAENWASGRLAAHRKLREAGHETVGFASLPRQLPRGHDWNQLPEDLLKVYREGRELTKRLGGLIRIWEMVGEPDTHFCRDLPERVVAYQKALYLGMRDGARRWGASQEPAILMGALGMFPGPWLERAAANGLFDYTDGLNFHYYGHARDFRGAIEAHRAFAKKFVVDRELPIWVTECGMNAVPGDDRDEERGREIQRAFTVETATVAREQGVAVFMPFILVHEGDGFAMVRPNGEPHPAWRDYAALTRRESLPRQSAVSRPESPNRVVVQWLPDNTTCFPDKVSGTYWFRGPAGESRPVSGKWVIYNFSESAISGTLRWDVEPGLRMSSPEGDELVESVVLVPAMGSSEVRVLVAPESEDYVRAGVRAEFVPAVVRPGVRRSVAVTAFASRPTRRNLPRTEEIDGRAPKPGEYHWIWAPEPVADESRGDSWTGLNGVVVEKMTGESGVARAKEVCFRVENDGNDPRLPPMAVMMVDGLPDPANGFLRLRFLPDSDQNGGVRVDLVDEGGQRFTVGENLGSNRYRSRPGEVLLAYADFHVYAFGRLSAEPFFDPGAIREIQLRFYTHGEPVKFCLKVDVLSAE